MKKNIPIILATMVLSSCASIIDSSSKDITMKTPGASNARCLIENVDMKYIAYTDETIQIMKSPHDLVVRCQAPGNREQTVHVKRGVNEWIFANVANGFVPGAAYDYLSRGAFDYPDTITVSFVGSPIKGYPLPAYHNKDMRHNNDYNKIEYMGPSTILTNETRHKKPEGLKKKEGLYGGGEDFDRSNSGLELDAIHRQYNPTVASSYDSTEEDK